MTFTSRVVPALLVASALVLVPRAAAADQVTVSSARQDAATGHLVVTGSGFRPGVTLALAGKALKVVAVESREVRAELPQTESGTYRLTVRNRYSAAYNFEVALGFGGGDGSGPQGPAGPQGPTGPQGPMGFVGPAGPTGAAGQAGAAGPQGPVGATGAQGLQGVQGATGAAGPAGASSGVMIAAANGAVFGSLLQFNVSSPSLVALEHNGVALVANVNPQGIPAMAFYALYADANCATEPFVPADSNPAPFLRLLQVARAGETTAYYAGNPMQVQSFLSLSELGHADTTCATTVGTGWDEAMLAGPQRSFDLSGFPAPFAVKTSGQ